MGEKARTPWAAEADIPHSSGYVRGMHADKAMYTSQVRHRQYFIGRLHRSCRQDHRLDSRHTYVYEHAALRFFLCGPSLSQCHKLNMHFLKQPSSHDDLPEAVAPTEVSAYNYSISSDAALHGAQKEVVPHELEQNLAAGRQKQKQWPFCLLYGVVVAIIAGVVGGFIGRAIFDGHKGHTFPHTEFSPPTNISSNKTLARILPIPTTGCSPVSERKYLKPAHSDFTAVHYTTLCATRWINNHLAAISAATPSDCIEACYSYNDYAPVRTCVGASFVPRWWNQTRAMEDKNASFNCFLMGQKDRIVPNDLEFEVVALCLEDACGGLVDG